MIRIISSSLCPLCLRGQSIARADWPEFRGPYGNGHVAAAGDANARRPAAHLERNRKRPLENADPAPRLVHARRHGRPNLAHHRHRRRPRLLRHLRRRRTGKILHNKKLFHSDKPEPLGNNVNCYAAPSPAIEPGRVYVHFGSYGTACLDTATGEVIWKRDDLPCRHYRGPSSSVVLFENLVILTLDGVDLQYVVALDKTTGETVWKTDRDVEWNDQNVTGEYAEVRPTAPTTATSARPTARRSSSSCRTASRKCSAAARRPRSPTTRAPARSCGESTYDDCRVAPRPLYHDGIAYIVTGIMHPELWAVRTDGTGNLTESDDVLWRLKSRRRQNRLAASGRRPDLHGQRRRHRQLHRRRHWRPRLAKTHRRRIRRIAHLRRRPHLLLRPGRRNHRHQTRPQIRSSSPPTPSTTAAWPRPPSTDERSILRTKTHLYRIENAAPAAN